jgi:tRNA (guanine-N7-)-methyltransferase
VNPSQRTAYLAAAERVKWKPADYFNETTLNELFARPAPLVLDLGCGDGGFLLALAQRHPEMNFLGTERLVSRVEKVARKIGRAGLANARVIEIENHFAVRNLLPAACATTVYVLHPDPWPKRYHHPRRLIQPEFMAAVHRVLVPGGELCVQTDDKPYFQWMEKVFAQCPQFERIEWKELPDWPQTDFEREFIAKGLPIYRARLRKV